MKRSGRPARERGEKDGKTKRRGTITNSAVKQLPMTRGKHERPVGPGKDDEEVDHVNRSPRAFRPSGRKKRARKTRCANISNFSLPSRFRIFRSFRFVERYVLLTSDWKTICNFGEVNRQAYMKIISVSAIVK